MADDTGISAIMPGQCQRFDKMATAAKQPQRRQKNSAIIIAFPLISAHANPYVSPRIVTAYGTVAPRFGHKPYLHVGDTSQVFPERVDYQ
jgi:hypothetical protein